MGTDRNASIHNYLLTATKIRNHVDGLPESVLLWKPSPKAWTINEIVGHLVDSNIVNSYRIRKIISEPVTPLATFAHEGWVEQQRFNDTPLAELLAAYDAITHYNALLLRKLTEEQWEKFGMKPEEAISVSHIIDSFICKHVDKHLQQIERNKNAYNEAN